MSGVTTCKTCPHMLPELVLIPGQHSPPALSGLRSEHLPSSHRSDPRRVCQPSNPIFAAEQGSSTAVLHPQHAERTWRVPGVRCWESSRTILFRSTALNTLVSGEASPDYMVLV